jgi:hypothetical protein
MLKFSSSILFICIACSVNAQQTSDTGALQVVITQKQKIDAQMKRLKSVLSYQSEIIALGKQDPSAAYATRRNRDQCDADTLGGLCAYLKATYK